MVKFQCRCGNVDYKRLSQLETMQFKCCRKCGRKNNYPDKRKIEDSLIRMVYIKYG